jgi:hypothetical protein
MTRACSENERKYNSPQKVLNMELKPPINHAEIKMSAADFEDVTHKEGVHGKEFRRRDLKQGQLESLGFVEQPQNNQKEEEKCVWPWPKFGICTYFLPLR